MQSLKKLCQLKFKRIWYYRCIAAFSAYIKKFKKISKRNLPNVGMGGWMEALADKVHKQGEHIATFHTTIPT